MDRQGPLRGVGLAPDGVDDVPLGAHAPAVAHQVGEDPVLDGGQVHLPAVHPRAPGVQVDAQAPVVDVGHPHGRPGAARRPLTSRCAALASRFSRCAARPTRGGGRRPLRARQGPADLGQEHLQGVGLGQVVVGPQVQAEHLVGLARARRDEDDARSRRRLAQAGAQGEAAHAGQADVEQDHGGRQRGQVGEGRLGGGAVLRAESEGLQVLARRARQLGLVLDEQHVDAPAGRPGLRASSAPGAHPRHAPSLAPAGARHGPAVLAVAEFAHGSYPPASGTDRPCTRSSLNPRARHLTREIAG